MEQMGFPFSQEQKKENTVHKTTTTRQEGEEAHHNWTRIPSVKFSIKCTNVGWGVSRPVIPLIHFTRNTLRR